MSLKKVYEYLGPNVLSFMTDQERKHWLMKTHKKKYLVDPNTGDTYQGRVDNLGSDVIIETRKLGETYSSLNDVQYTEKFRAIFDNEPSAFTYNSSVNGLSFARILSTNFPYSPYEFHHYRIHFKNCEKIFLPFASSNASADVYAEPWIKTTTPPVIKLMTSEGQYTTEVSLTFDPVDKYVILSEEPDDWQTNYFDYYYKTATGYVSISPGYTLPPTFIANTYFKKIQVSPEDVTYYYPINPNIAPLDITQLSSSEWYTEGVTNMDQIGLPAFWFTCNLTNVGPSIVLNNAVNNNNDEMFCVGNVGTESKYHSHMYVDVAGRHNATPSQAATSSSYVYVSPDVGLEFTGTASDYNIALNPSNIKMNNLVLDMDYVGTNTKFFMSPNSGWEYVNNAQYKILVSTFDDNCYAFNHDPIVPVIDIHFDESVSFGIDTTDIGFIGIRGGSGNTESDIYEKYPYNLNKFDGLPDHLTNPNPEDPQEHMAIYAVHNTPSYIETDPNTRQTAAVLLDPGRAQHPENNIPYDFVIPNNDPEKNWYSDSDLPDEYNGDNFFFQILDPSYGLVVPGIYDSDDESGGYPNGKTYTAWASPTPNTFVAVFNFAAFAIETISYRWDATEEEYVKQYTLTYGKDYDSNGGLSHLWYQSNVGFNWNSNIVKNTKEDGSGYEYIDIVAVTNSAETGAAVMEHDVGVRLRIFRNLDLGEANYTRGRVYIISNDPSEYDNNVTSSTPKPDRTAARICDIPTSIAQLSGIKNVAPTYVVDQQYVRTEACYSEKDRDRLYNVNSTRWVRPIHLTENGNAPTHTNDFVFTSVEQLNSIDLINHNEFRYLKNLVPMVAPENVSLANIVDSGTGYSASDFGYVYIGGFGFEYHVGNVDSKGRVIDASLSYPELDNDRSINLSNFNMAGDTPYTAAYGTTRKTGRGTGLKLQLYIANYEQIQTYKGGVYKDLFALVRDSEGLWLYNYEVEERLDNNEDLEINGTWRKNVQISQFESSDIDATFLSTSDAFLASILPITHEVPCCVYTNNTGGTKPLQISSTASFVQIMSTNENETPIKNYNDTSEYKQYDLTKWYCDGLIQLSSVSSMDNDGILEALSKVATIRSDCYIAWRPSDDGDPSNVSAVAGIIYRSFNNLRSDATSTLLPSNKLKYQNYVNTNANTTIAWDVPGIGPMVWVFNPNYRYHEIYTFDPSKNKVLIERELIDWSKVDIQTNNITYTESLVDENNILKYNIITNNQFHVNASSHRDQSVIYSQPEFYTVATIGTDVSTIAFSNGPTGNWHCVFPRVSGFKFQKEDGSMTESYTPTEMNIIHGVNVGGSMHVYDDDTKQDVSSSTVLFEDTSNGVIVKIFNSATNKWESI